MKIRLVLLFYVPCLNICVTDTGVPLEMSDTLTINVKGDDVLFVVQVNILPVVQDDLFLCVEMIFDGREAYTVSMR